MASQKLLPAVADSLHTPPGRDLSFYLVLFVAVLPIWSVVPFSWAFVIYALHYGLIWNFAWRGWTVFAVALSEVFFSVYHYNLASFISRPSPNGSGDLHELRRAFHRVLQAGLASLPEEGYDEETLDVDRPGSPEETVTNLDFEDPRAIDFRNYLRTWFRRAPWSSIRRHEMFAWLYWSIFNAPFAGYEKVSETKQKVLDEVIDLLEQRAGVKIPEGSNPTATPLLLTVDPVNVSWRPLIWYAGVALSNAFLRRRFVNKWNAKVATYNDLEYILRVPATWNARTGPRPVVFMHGLGLGLSQYCRFLEHIFAAAPDHPILVPLLPHVSQEILHPRYLRPMGRQEMVQCLAGLISELGWADIAKPMSDTSDSDSEKSGVEARVRKGVTMLSHSNGSFGHAWLLKAHPGIVTRSCFVDPICAIILFTDHVKMAWISSSNTSSAMELGVANFLQRHFDWSSNSLWYEEIPNAKDPKRTMFFLGGKDTIIDADRVRRYLSSHGVRKNLRFDPDGHHGEALLTRSPFHNDIMNWLREE
uniref:Cellulose-growth-specific protein n=1 Tax=Ganoderma boninense TaxID=34458 RepID=A0A5K1JU13_9APHY|nr:Cellulose-growth-specific protein [Ganoderma boninense]